MKNFLIITQNHLSFQMKNLILHPNKKFLILTQKTDCLPEEKLSYAYPKT